ncbi:LLM class flavin-dependent oxidoreductase [Phenylobacterium sp. LjRoot219]|uniref:LLM class flavin-dependent oxidoreductase n=1 Tax=Phenylobacterium sp. LjRoot219 TaxID=3342283 RepID=UPI003ECC8D1B
MKAMQLGFAAPIFANPGVADFRTPNFEKLDRAAVVAGVREAERLGYDSLWVADHMFLGRDGAILEGWTTLAYLAGCTSRMRLGPIHLGNGFRPAPLAAKMIATLDFLSDGRFELFIDPGWRGREHTAYGFEWEPDRAKRVAQVEEALVLMRALWSGEPTTHKGDFYDIEGAICTPPPVGRNGPRVWIGEAFDEPTLDLIARHADVWNSMPAGLDVLAEKIARVDHACAERGRDPRTLAKTLETQVLVYEDAADAERLFARFDELSRRYPSGEAMTDVVEFVKQGNPHLDGQRSRDSLYDEFLIGTPDEVAAKLRAYSELGITEVICWFMDFPDFTSMRLLAESVVPTLEAGRS